MVVAIRCLQEEMTFEMRTCLKTRIRNLYSLCEKEGNKFVSEWQTAEQIVVPMLFCMGWGTAECRSRGISLIRTGAAKDFDLLFLNLSKRIVYMGVECKRMMTSLSGKKKVVSTNSPSNDSFSEQIIRYKTESNSVSRGVKNKGFRFDSSAKFLWTNGVEWILFKDASFTRTERQKQCVSNLFADGAGTSYGDYFMRFSFLKDNEDAWHEQFESLARALTPEWGNGNNSRR